MKFEQKISEEIFIKKYMLNGEKNADEVFSGVAKEIASAEKKKNREKYENLFYNMMKNGYFIPGGRILANARPNTKLKQYNNCFTIDIEDSMEGIFNSIKEDALISAGGGGVGFNISKLRPEGSVISHGGDSSGPLSFLKVFNESAKVIHTGGSRRSAHICILNVDHPDIEKFITIKNGDENKQLTQFNISVGITNKFMEAVKNDKEWDLVFNGKIYKTLKATYLYDLMTKNAFTHNEPGILNIDEAQKYNNGYYAFEINVCNPCLTGDALVLTPNGYVRADTLNEGDEIITKKNTTSIIKTKEVNFNMKVKEYHFSNGKSLKATDSHIFYSNGKEKKAATLTIGDKIDSISGLVDIINIENVNGLHTVYDFFEESTDSWIANEIINRGCGEIVMAPYSMCDLGALFLPRFVKNAFTVNAYFDYDEFDSYIHLGIRFLDDVLDATEYPLEKIKAMSYDWRRIGLGFTGLATALTMLGYTYGEEDGNEECEIIAQTLRDSSYFCSTQLAKEKGSFRKFNKQKILDANFIKQLPEYIRSEIKKHGLRNIAMNTIAPTGTISLTVGNNCSSGIEPVFSYEYDRNIRTGRGDETTKEKVYDYGTLLYKKMFPSEETIILPSYFKTTFDIDPYKSVDVQAIFQKYIDHSISKTANLPSGYTIEQYKNLFMYAYDKGLKGFTSYNPNGSMKGVLEISKSEKDRPVDRHNAPKRPNDLVCDIHEISINGSKYIISVGKYEDTIYEMFVVNDLQKVIDIEKHREGIIRKRGKGLYDLIISNGEEKVAIEDISKTCGDEYASLSRLISMSLRHGVPLEFIIEQLTKSTSFVSFGKVVARVLKKYLKDGEAVKTSHKCPECGNADLKYIDGCISCVCGFSKCS